MSKPLKIVFLGTPDFAVASLRILVENDLQIVGVVTAPDKPQGRGKKLGISAVKAYALDKGLFIMQPTNLKSAAFLEELRSLEADLQVVVAFRMLPVAVWDMPRLGTFNLHASLLPQYRGAAPIHWALISGETQTGVTTFFLKHEIDTGEIIFQEEEEILPSDSVGALYGRLMDKGAQLVLKTVRAIEAGNYPQLPQILPDVLKSAPKIFKSDCEIDWSQPSKRVMDFIRGLSPAPGAWTYFDGQTLKVFAAEKADISPSTNKEGVQVHDHRLVAKTADCWIEITDMQLQGKKRMKAEAFLRGFVQKEQHS